MLLPLDRIPSIRRRTLPALTPALLPALLLTVLAACPHQGEPETGPPLSADEEAAAAKLAQLAEVEVDQLTRDGRRQLVRVAGEQKCPCADVSGSLAECAEREGECIRARFAVRAIVRAVARKETDAKLTAQLLERFGPREPEVIKLADAPCRGPARAPVVMVLFSDFQCPYCGLATKLTEEILAAAGERLRVCFKHWPLTHIHKHAELAARATVAAQLQGKFWQMHDKLFANAKALERDDLLDYAREIGLDEQRFAGDLDSERVAARVAADAAEAGRLRLTGTPTFFINGRMMTDPKNVPTFLDWIAEALALAKAGAGTTRPAAPRPAASQPAASQPAVP